jgi:hypothetical protein
MKMQGRVIKKQVARGSKSERKAVLLSTDEGEFVLRRQGGNAFQDEVLDGLVGQNISCTGQLHGYTFIIKSWKELAEEE